jgi:hypothetical protein
MTLENMFRGTGDYTAMFDQAYGLRKDRKLERNGAGPMELDMVSLKDRESVGYLANLRLAASYLGFDGSRVSYITEVGNFRVVAGAGGRRIFIRLHVFGHLTIRTAVSIGDEAIPSLSGACGALRVVRASLQRQADQEWEKNRYGF